MIIRKGMTQKATIIKNKNVLQDICVLHLRVWIQHDVHHSMHASKKRKLNNEFYILNRININYVLVPIHSLIIFDVFL